MIIRFIGCLYKSPKKAEQFESYFQTCLKTIQAAKTVFPESIFELHVDKTLNESEVEMLRFLGANVMLHQYPVSQKEYSSALFSSSATRIKNCDQLTKCMRLAPLFDAAKFSNQTICIVIDIHDDFSMTARLIQAYLSRENQAYDYLLTRWKSTESDCHYDDDVTFRTHYHFDAGLVIAKKPFPQSDEDMSFVDFCIAKIMQSPSRLIKGVEEMLMDEYLKEMDFYEKYKSKIKLFAHTCRVDRLFYETKAVANSQPVIAATAQRGQCIVQRHPAPQTQLSDNPLDSEIYVCTQKPLRQAHARRQRS